MINIDNKIYRNLEEQVRKNQKDINDLRFGLNIVGKVADYTLLPSEAKVGEAYLVGTSYPYHVWVRTEETPATWDNLGTLSSTVPGPRGEQGPKGDNGRSIENTTIDQNGYLTIWYSDGTSEQLAHRVQGVPGKVGPMGLQGPQGPQGVQGPKGNKGDQGTIFTIVGKLNGIGELPDPVTTKDTDAYLVNSGKINTQDQPIYDLYINTNKEWINCGSMTGYNTRIWKINAPEDATNGVFTPSELSNIKDRSISFIQLHNYLYSPTAENVGGFMLYKSITDDSINVLSINTASGSWSMSSTPLQLVWNVDMIPVNGIEENKLAQSVIDKLNSIETKAPQSAITEINNTLKKKADLIDGKIPVEQMPNVGSKVEFAEKDSRGNVIVDTYATKKEVSTLIDDLTTTVDCNHKYEITGNTGDEHGLAIEDQQMLITKIQGHTGIKSPNLIHFKPGTYGGVQVKYDEKTGIHTFNGTSTGASIPLNQTYPIPQGTTVSFIGYVVGGTKTGAQNDIGIMIDGTWIATDWVNTKTLSESISGCWMSTDITFTNYQVKINAVEGTYTKDTMPMFQPYDNTFANSNNVLISTGRNILNPDDFGANCSTYDKATGIAKIYASRENDDKTLMPSYYFAPNTQYTFIFKGKNGYNDSNDTNDGPTNIVIKYTNGTSTQMFFKTVDTDTTLKTTSTKGLTIDSLSIINQASTTTLYLNECAVIKGVDMPFEPYKQDIVQAPMLGEFDYYQEGKIVRQTSQIVTLNGSENWKIEEISPSKRFIVGLLNQYGGCLNDNYTINTTNNLGIENQTTGTTWTGTTTSISAEGDNLHLIIEGITTVEQLKEWLKNNNIQMVFRLATPTIEDYAMPSGYAVYNGGLQIQQGDGLPYTITKQYNLSQKAQILANIEIDREQQDQLNELRSKAAATSSLGWEDVWEGTLTLNNPNFTIEQSLADKLKDKNTIYAFSFTDSSSAPEDYGSYGIVYASYQHTGSVSTLTGNGIVLQDTYEPYFIRIWLEGNTLHSRYTNSMGEGEVLLLTAIRKLTLK